MRNVVKVSKRKKEQAKAKEKLGKQIEKVRTLAVKKGVKQASITRALKELEKKMSEVIEKEKQAISKTKGLSTELKSMEERFSSFTTKDIQIITALKDRIEQLENSRAQQIDKAVEELKSRLREMEETTSGRDRRIIELEKKIKEKVSSNFQGLMRIEQQLEMMELKYKKMKREGKHDKDMLGSFKEKIQALKKHAFVKKQKLIEDEMKKGAPLPELPKEFKPRIKPIKRERPRGFIRHDVVMPSAPKPEAGEEETFAEILKEEHIPLVRLKRERPKKKGFFRRLFGR
jgi:chromosome segregation ATPase